MVTLAAAASLDYLLYVNGPVIIPDAVFFEATRDVARLGAGTIVEWVNANLGRVHIAPTNAFTAFARDYEAGLTERELDLGERAAIEYARHRIHLEPDERAVLLSEDRKVTGLRIAREESPRVIIITMRDFLRELKRIGRINSTRPMRFTTLLLPQGGPRRAESYSISMTQRCVTPSRVCWEEVRRHPTTTRKADQRRGCPVTPALVSARAFRRSCFQNWRLHQRRCFHHCGAAVRMPRFFVAIVRLDCLQTLACPSPDRALNRLPPARRPPPSRSPAAIPAPRRNPRQPIADLLLGPPQVIDLL